MDCSILGRDWQGENEFIYMNNMDIPTIIPTKCH